MLNGMYDNARWDRAEAQVRDGVARNMSLFEEAVELAKKIRPVHVIRDVQATLNSVVASDGGHNTIEAFPFMALGAIRVVDAAGEELFFDVIGPKDDTDVLSQRHLDTDTALGRLMRGLGVTRLSDLSTMIPPSPSRPRPARANDKPKKTNSTGWMTVYRDLCEWAAIYDMVVHKDHLANNTVVLRDGLLRTKIFAQDYFVQMGRLIEARIEELRDRRRRNLYLVGIAKKSEVIARYGLAMQLNDTFRDGAPYWAAIPMELQDEVYVWPEYIRLPETVDEAAGVATPSTEDPKFNIGAMHFVRFGPSREDPVWTVDTLHSQHRDAGAIFGALLNSTRMSFPIPAYPQPLIDADAQAQISSLDAEVLRDWFLSAVGDNVPPSYRQIIDAQVLNVDYAARRYS